MSFHGPSVRAEERQHEISRMDASNGSGDPTCTNCKGSGVDEWDDGVPVHCPCAKCAECRFTVFDDIDGFALGPAAHNGKRVCVDCAKEIVDIYLANGMTANEVLGQIGLTHRPRGTTKHDYLRADRVVFVGTISAMNEWLARGGDWAVAS